MSTLNDIAVDHPYYCSDSNYYSNEPSMRYEPMTEYLDEFENADIDMNLMFRWDISKQDDGNFSAEIFLIHQRKGIFRPIMIGSVSEEEAVRFKGYAKRHWEVLNNMWKPLS